MTVAQTMEVVHGLFANMTEVMDGMWIFLEPVCHSVLTVPFCVDGKTSTNNIREALGTFGQHTQLAVPDHG